MFSYLVQGVPILEANNPLSYAGNVLAGMQTLREGGEGRDADDTMDSQKD